MFLRRKKDSDITKYTLSKEQSLKISEIFLERFNSKGIQTKN